jgi:hypothetical protein
LHVIGYLIVEHDLKSSTFRKLAIFFWSRMDEFEMLDARNVFDKLKWLVTKAEKLYFWKLIWIEQLKRPKCIWTWNDVFWMDVTGGFDQEGVTLVVAKVNEFLWVRNKMLNDNFAMDKTSFILRIAKIYYTEMIFDLIEKFIK